jgi:hypothetical protein
MKAIIILDIYNGKSSAVVVEHQTTEELHKLQAKLALTPEVRKATIIAANLTGRTIIAEQYDSPETIAQIASW